MTVSNSPTRSRVVRWSGDRSKGRDDCFEEAIEQAIRDCNPNDTKRLEVLHDQLARERGEKR